MTEPVHSDTTVAEASAGCVLVQEMPDGPRALLIRVRKDGYEVPKGHIEAGETPAQAALRELREETNLQMEAVAGPDLGTLRYTFPQEGRSISKTVQYFLVRCPTDEAPVFGLKPSRTREMRWLREEELAAIPLVNEALRPIIARAFRLAGEMQVGVGCSVLGVGEDLR